MTFDQRNYERNSASIILPIVAIINPKLTLKDSKRAAIIKEEKEWYNYSVAKDLLL